MMVLEFGFTLYWGKIKPTKKELQTIKEITHKQAEHYARDCVVREIIDYEPLVHLCIYKEGFVVLPLSKIVAEIPDMEEENEQKAKKETI